MVECGGLENRCTERYRGFESLSLRSKGVSRAVARFALYIFGKSRLPDFSWGGGFFFFFLEPVQLQTNSSVDFFYIFASGANRSAVACVFFRVLEPYLLIIVQHDIRFKRKRY